MRRDKMLTLGIAMALTAAAPMQVVAQQPGRAPQQLQQEQQQQQMMRMQEHIQHLNRVMERMDGIQQRAQVMERQMAQEMQQLQGNAQLAEQNALQLRHQERLRNMAQSMNDGAREMYRAMEQLKNMAGEPGAAWDGTTERDMQQLREHWEEMAGDMEDGLQILDRLRDRIQDRVHQEEPQ